MHLTALRPSKIATSAALRWFFASGHPAYIAIGTAMIKARLAVVS